jgi:catechol 2,3-dioxygenase-like lactoylglutathione lyase family enzyme
MFKAVAAFNGISVKDLAEAKDFYTGVLGLELVDDKMGLHLSLPGGGKMYVYESEKNHPASFTVLNFVVEDIDNAVDELVSSGVKFEHYDDMPAKQDSKEILRGLSANMGPDIAWFKDPAGNILSVLQDK